jgi:hypothetical protein
VAQLFRLASDASSDGRTGLRPELRAAASVGQGVAGLRPQPFNGGGSEDDGAARRISSEHVHEARARSDRCQSNQVLRTITNYKSCAHHNSVSHSVSYIYT